MTKEKLNRFLACLLVFCLLLSQNLTAFAQGEETETAAETAYREDAAVSAPDPAEIQALEAAVTSEGEISQEELEEAETVYPDEPEEQTTAVTKKTQEQAVAENTSGDETGTNDKAANATGDETGTDDKAANATGDEIANEIGDEVANETGDGIACEIGDKVANGTDAGAYSTGKADCASEMDIANEALSEAAADSIPAAQTDRRTEAKADDQTDTSVISTEETVNSVAEGRTEAGLSANSEGVRETEQDAQEATVQTKRITGYRESGVILSLSYDYSMKPSLKRVLTFMPKTLMVQLDGTNTYTEISVSWYCVGDDYTYSEGHLFQFSPVFGEEYDAGDELEIISKAPYINVLIDGSTELNGSSSIGGISTLATGTGSTMSTTDNRDTIFNFLVKEMGLNNAAASGVVANIYYESGFNPNALGDNGTSYGICQWHNGRYTNLKNYCANNGYDYKTLSGQLHYLNYELNQSTYVSILKYLRSVDNTAEGAYNAAYYWCYYFEIPASRATASVTRGNYAKNTIWPIYKAATVSDETPVSESSDEETSPAETTPAATEPETAPAPADVCPPSSLKATADTGSITLTWSRAENATGYRIYRAGTESEAGVLLKEITDGSVTTYTDSTASVGRKYYYMISAINAGEIYDICKTTANLNYRNAPSTEGSVVGTIPSGTQVFVIRGSEVQGSELTWVKVWYKGTFSYCAAKYLSLVCEGEKPQAKESSLSTKVCAVIPLSSVKGFQASNDLTGVKLTWSAVTGAQGYLICQKNNDGSFTQLARITGGSTLTYTDTDMSCVTSGTTITYKITAYTDAVSSAGTECSLCYMKAPGLTSVTNTTNGVKLTYTRVQGAEGYNIYRKVEGGSFKKYAQVSGESTTSFHDSQVESGTTYLYTVRAYYGTNLSAYETGLPISYIASTTISLSNTQSGVRISWKQVSAATGYQIYRRLSDESCYSLITTVSGGNVLSYTDQSLKSGVTAKYAVKAIKEDTKCYISAYSPVVPIIYLSCPALSSVSAQAGGVVVKWGCVAGAGSYYVYRKPAGGSYTRLAEVTGLSYTDTKAASGTTYEYTVRAVSGSYLSYYNSIKKLTFLAAPALSSVSAVTGGVKISWSKVTGASGYYVYRKTTGGSYSKLCQVTGGSTTSCIDKTAASGNQYTYTVRAYYGTCLSYYKTGLSLNYLASPTVSLATVETGLQISWKQISGANGYQIYRKQTGEAAYTLIRTVSGGSMVSYIDKTAASGSSASYQVRAIKVTSNPTFVTTENLYYRVGPAKTYTAKGLIPKGTSVTGIAGSEIPGDGTGWMQVSYEGGIYYCNTPWLKMTSNGTIKAAGACSQTISKYYLSTPALSGAAQVTGGIKVSFGRVAGASGYYVYRKTAGGSWAKIGTISSGSTLTYTDKTGTKGKTYYYTVRAYNGNNLSGFAAAGVSCVMP